MTTTGAVHVRGEGGQVIQMDLPLPETITDRLTRGYLHLVNPDGSPIAPPDHPPAGEDPPGRPVADASTADWVGYAVRRHGLTPDEAEALTRQDLIDLDTTTAAAQSHVNPAGHDTGDEPPAPQPPVGEQPPAPDPPAGPLPRPPVAANKAAWVDYAISQGMDRAAADAATKQHLTDTL